MGSFSIWHWLVVLLVVVLVFGTKKLKNVGSDLGGAVKGFRDAMRNGEEEARQENAQLANEQRSAEKTAEQKDSQST